MKASFSSDPISTHNFSQFHSFHAKLIRRCFFRKWWHQWSIWTFSRALLRTRWCRATFHVELTNNLLYGKNYLFTLNISVACFILNFFIVSLFFSKKRLVHECYERGLDTWQFCIKFWTVLSFIKLKNISSKLHNVFFTSKNKKKYF